MEHLPAKKSLGQNFLRSKEALNTIIEAGDIQPEDTILEIGPGEGVLTEKLLEKARKVVAVELDDRLIPTLQTKFACEIEEKKLELIHGDILTFDLQSLKLTAKSYKLMANIPYYITGEIIRKFLEAKHQPQKIVLLLQKEVAKRIVTHDKKESILSLSVKVYGTPHYEGVVKKEAFKPVPKVDSAILSISNISKDNFKNVSEEFFFNVIKTGFSQKRKKLISNLGALFPKEKLVQAFSECRLEELTRAENVELHLWIKLCEKLIH